MPAITTSIFELLKIGPGPSSSHTIGPMKAGYDFMELMRKLPEKDRLKSESLEIRIFGSLSATGKGHGTPRAIMSGLLGYLPDTCQADTLEEFKNTDKSFELDIDGKVLIYHTGDIIFDAVKHDYPHSNTMIFRLKAGEDILLERMYFSVGGGFLRWQGWEEPQRGKPAYPYGTMAELKKHLKTNAIQLGRASGRERVFIAV